MTVIVAVSDGQRVCMASDSRVSNGEAFATMAPASKVLRRGEVVFGAASIVYADAFRLHFPESKLYSPAYTMSFMEWVSTVLAPDLQNHLRSRGAMERNKDTGAEEFPSNALVAWRNEIVLLDGGGAPFNPAEPYSAIGSGFNEARALAWWFDSISQDDCVFVASRAVEAAIALDRSCGGPVHCETTDPAP